MRRLAFLGLLAGCAGSAVTVSHPELEAEASRTELIDVSASAGTVLDLATPAGDVTVEVGEGPAQVVASLRLMARTEAEAERILSAFAVIGRLEAGVFVVRIDGEPVEIEGTGLRVRPLVSLAARVPKGQRVRVGTGSGKVEIKGALGDCAVTTAFGDVRVRGARGEAVRAKTSSGSVRIEDVEARFIEVDTAFGDVRVEAVKGDLDVDTGSGDVVLKGFAGACAIQTGFGDIEASGAFGDLTAKTSSGRVDVVAEPGSSVERPWSLQSAFGDVDVRVPLGFDCDLLAETSFGCVTSDVTVHGPGRLTDQRVRGEIGEGGALLTLRTSSGDIRIRAE
jgi:hypothetical protein